MGQIICVIVCIKPEFDCAKVVFGTFLSFWIFVYNVKCSDALGLLKM